MTPWETLLLDTIAVFMALWISNLVRCGKLYVGYGVVVLSALGVMSLAISIGTLRSSVTSLVQWLFPTMGYGVLASAIAALGLVYVLSQLSIISNRLAFVIQELAIEGAADLADEKPPHESSPGAR